MDIPNTITSNVAPTIDKIDALGTPSLVGYWKCDDGGGLIVQDQSGKGSHLQIICPTDIVGYLGGDGCNNSSNFNYIIDTMWNRFPGFLSLGFGAGAMVDITGHDLAAVDRLTIFGAEFIVDTDSTKTYNGNAATAIDFDVGTYWAGNDGGAIYTAYFAPAQGFNIGSAGPAPTSSQFFARVSDSVNSAQEGPSLGSTNAIYSINAAYNPIPVTETLATRISKDGVIVATSSSGVVPASIPPHQLDGSPYFGIRAQNEFSPNWGIRNLYAWQYTVDRDDIAQILNDIAVNPGVSYVPPYLVGK